MILTILCEKLNFFDILCKQVVTVIDIQLYVDYSHKVLAQNAPKKLTSHTQLSKSSAALNSCCHTGVHNVTENCTTTKLSVCSQHENSIFLKDHCPQPASASNSILLSSSESSHAIDSASHM